MLNYVDMKLRRDLQDRSVEGSGVGSGGGAGNIMVTYENEEEKMSDIMLTKLLLDIPQPFISSQSWIVYDSKSESILFGKMERERREIASLTKIMTCFVVLNLINRFKMDERKEMIEISE